MKLSNRFIADGCSGFADLSLSPGSTTDAEEELQEPTEEMLQEEENMRLTQQLLSKLQPPTVSIHLFMK